MIASKYSIFESTLQVMPDAIDMFGHVHNSKYLDYVLAARYQQMDKHYGMGWEAFVAQNLGWVVSKVTINYKRALTLGDIVCIKTGILEIYQKGCCIQFEIRNQKSNKIVSDGIFEYTLIDITTGKSCKVTPEMIKAYSI